MSTIRTNTLSNVAGTQSTAIENAINGSAKAWVNFNGSGTVAIRQAFNVSSITDNGTGDYTLNFTNALTDANYAPSISYGAYSTGAAIIFMAVQAVSNTSGATLKTTTQLRIICSNGSAAAYDNAEVYVAIFR